LCPDCERARSARLVARFDAVAAKMSRSTFLTLTIPNVARGDLELGIDVLLDAMAHFRRQAIFRGGPCRCAHRATAFDDVDRREHHAADGATEPCSHPPHRRALAASGQCRCARCLEVDLVSDGQRVTSTGCPRCTHRPIVGGVYSLEITWSPELGTWHPHAHLLLDGPWLPRTEIRDAWRAATCDATQRAERARAGQRGRVPVCPHQADEQGRSIDGCQGASIAWIEAVHGEPGSPEHLAAVRETLKYVSKGLLDEHGELLPGATHHEIGEMVLALRNRRLISGWGSFRNVHDAEEEQLDPAEFLVGPGVEPALLGLPRRCPVCHGEARWELPIDVPRRGCRPLGGGYLAWRPSPVGTS
jgi:hypothetical protein